MTRRLTKTLTLLLCSTVKPARFLLHFNMRVGELIAFILVAQVELKGEECNTSDDDFEAKKKGFFDKSKFFVAL